MKFNIQNKINISIIHSKQFDCLIYLNNFYNIYVFLNSSIFQINNELKDYEI